MIFKPHFLSRGVSLVESLIAVAIIGFGLLGLTRLQLNLIRNAGDTAHRVEAIRMAQQKIEEMRGLAGTEPSESPSIWRGLVSGEDESNDVGNVRYARSWAIGGSPSDSQRIATVTVRWADRSNSKASGPTVVLSTALSSSNPDDAGHLALPPAGGFVKLINRRHASVPRSAVSLRGANNGRSALKDPSGDKAYLVIDDANGLVIARCDVRPNDTTAIESECTPQSEAFLQGYIESAEFADARAIRFENATPTGDLNSVECDVSRAASAEGRPIPNHYRYQCRVAMTTNARSSNLPPTWEGRLSFRSLSVGITACRYADDGAPQSYTHVAGSLDNQNFILTAESTCPSGTELQPSS
jgi:Tfp pilus assembly protein PilV